MYTKYVLLQLHTPIMPLQHEVLKNPPLLLRKHGASLLQRRTANAVSEITAVLLRK
jgi:hypothetical protein